MAPWPQTCDDWGAMKPIKTLALLAFVLAPGVAAAQGYYGGSGPGYYNQPQQQQNPGGFHQRQGRLLFGASVGLGAMNDDVGDIDCTNCSDLSLQGALHVGGFIGPRLALMGEVQGNAQTLAVDSGGGTETLVQSALMIAAQYWVTPQLWVKGGIGFANLRVDWSAYGDGIIDAQTAPENGVALLGAVGYEVMSARNFSVDIQGRLINGSYDAIDNNVTALSVGVGLNWY
jgi:hypothetical protein